MSLSELSIASLIKGIVRAYNTLKVFVLARKAQMIVAVVKGLYVGFFNASTNRFSEKPLSTWRAFLIGFIAGFVGGYMALKSPFWGGVIENLIIDFGTEIVDETEMSFTEFVSYIGFSVMAGTMQSFLGKHLPSGAPAYELKNFIVQIDVGLLTNVLRGYWRLIKDW
ncbi:hypothetical protein ACFLS1_12550 [Verrucomicrobiota bacterium]